MDTDPIQRNWTPLMRAIALGTLDDIRAALAHEGQYDHVDAQRHSPWTLAVMTGDVHKTRLLLDHGFELEGPDIAYAVEADRARMIHWLHARGASLNPPGLGDPPLIRAAELGHTGCVRALLALGADVFATNAFGDQAITEAANIATVRLLVAAGADPNRSASHGYSLLWIAVEQGKVDFVRDLLALGVDPNVNSLGETPLRTAVRDDNRAIVRLLLDAGADPNIVTIDEWYPLQSAKSLVVVTMLLDAGADVLFTDSFGKRPIDHHTDRHIVACLQQAQADALRRRSRDWK